MLVLDVSDPDWQLVLARCAVAGPRVCVILNKRDRLDGDGIETVVTCRNDLSGAGRRD